MRTGSVLAILMLGALIAFAGPRATSAASGTRHDGTVKAVDANTRTLVIREFGANARAYDFRIHVAPAASVVLSERNPKATDVGREFTSTPIRLSEIKRGDFVVVDVTGHGAHALGESVMVTLRSGA